MATARADSWHDSSVPARRPVTPPRRTPPPLPPLPELAGRAGRPAERRARRPGADQDLRSARVRDGRLPADRQHPGPQAPRRPVDPGWDAPASGRDRRPAVGERPDTGTGSRRRSPAPRPSAATDGGRVRGIVAVLGIFLATLAGGAVDSFTGTGLGMLTLITLVASTAVATLTVRRQDLVTVVLSPPLVFIAVAGVNIAAAPSATLTLPTVATLLIRGFPTMSAATAAALVLALVRIGTRR